MNTLSSALRMSNGICVFLIIVMIIYVLVEAFIIAEDDNSNCAAQSAASFEVQKITIVTPQGETLIQKTGEIEIMIDPNSEKAIIQLK